MSLEQVQEVRRNWSLKNFFHCGSLMIRISAKSVWLEDHFEASTVRNASDVL